MTARGTVKNDEVAEQILEYLRGHPHACDTLEGIARWWIMDQRLCESVLIVQQALGWLKAKRLVLERTMPDGRTLYYPQIEKSSGPTPPVSREVRAITRESENGN